MKKIIKLFNWDKSDLVKVLFGSFLSCLAVNIFIVPNNLYTGGVLGIAQLTRSIINTIFNIQTNFDYSGILYYLINVPLFFMAYKQISKSFFVRTLFAVTIQTIMLSIIPTVSIIDDMLVNILIGGIVGGIGIGITLSCGASTGGTDIVGMIVTKKHENFSVGKLCLTINVILYSIAGAMYGLDIMIYSIISSFAESMMIDKTHKQNIVTQAFIFSKKNPKVLNEYIKNELNRDFTYWNALGGYDDSKTYIIYTALSKYELIKLEAYMNELNFDAFIVKSEGVSVKGDFEKCF